MGNPKGQSEAKKPRNSRRPPGGGDVDSHGGPSAGTPSKAGNEAREGVRFVCDSMRHLVCVPYTLANLHRMAEILGIGRHWFHRAKYPHYDIPKRRVREIMGRVEVVTPRELLRIVQAGVKDV